MGKIKKIRYSSEKGIPKHIEKWIVRMQKTLDAMPKGTFLSADGSLHYFSEYKDGSKFEACTTTKGESSTQANQCKLHTFDTYCEGGDFW